VRAPRRRRRPGHRADLGWATLFLAPSTIGLTTFYIWPTIKTLYYSFTPGAVRREHVHRPGQLPVSLVLAALLAAKGRRGVRTYRVLMFRWSAPCRSPSPSCGGGCITVSTADQHPVSDPHTALLAVALVAVWATIGYGRHRSNEAEPAHAWLRATLAAAARRIC
jgi:multiple sugar transport system permease protein